MKMYEDQVINGGASFDHHDPNTLHEDNFSQTHLPNINTNTFSDDQNNSHNYPCPNNQHDAASAALDMEELQHHFNLDIEQCNYDNTHNVNNNHHQEIHHDQITHHHDTSNWHDNTNNTNFNDHVQNVQNVQNGHFTTTPSDHLLTMFTLPRCSSSSSSLLPNSFSNKSSSFLASLGLLGTDLNPTVDSSGNTVYDPLLPLNLPPQPPLLRELFHSLPHGGGGYNGNLLGGGGGGGGGRINGSLFGGVDNMDHVNVNVGCYNQGCDSGVFEFTAGEMDFNGKINRDGKDTKHFATERHRRVLLNDKYSALRTLVPNPTKNDRASIVGDAIEYINELKRTVTELKVLVEKKRCIRERLKRPKTEDENGNESKSVGDNPYNGSSLRSSWLHRKSKNTEVDVRIIDDEVTIKLVQQKRINCLLFVSKVLDDLQLDLHHVAGGLIGDYYSFLFNSKICEGSIVYASAIANKLIEVVDKQYSAILPTNSY